MFENPEKFPYLVKKRQELWENLDVLRIHYLGIKTNIFKLFPYRKDHETDSRFYVLIRHIERRAIDYLASGLIINYILWVWRGIEISITSMCAISLALFTLATLSSKVWDKFVAGMKEIARSFPKR